MEPNGRDALDLSEVSNRVEMSIIQIVQAEGCTCEDRRIESLASSDRDSVRGQILVEIGRRRLRVSACYQLTRRERVTNVDSKVTIKAPGTTFWSRGLGLYPAGSVTAEASDTT